MPYHTGTMGSTRETTGVGVQYRYIEDLWTISQYIGNMLGIYGGGYSIITSPYKSGEYKKICVPRYASPEYIVDWYVPSDDLYSWAMCPLVDSTGNIVVSETNYSCGTVDQFPSSSSSTYYGYLKGPNGLFCIKSIYSDTSSSNISGRKIYLE